jgi:hypothetical protein
LRFLLLVVLVVVATLLGNSPLMERAELQEQAAAVEAAAVEADAVGELETNLEAPVIISLALPEVDLAHAGVTEMRNNTAIRQARVLSDLSTSDFQTTYQYDNVPALAGRLTKAGMEKLAGNPDVTMISLDRLNEPGLAESVPLIHADDGGIIFLGLDGTA